MYVGQNEETVKPVSVLERKKSFIQKIADILKYGGPIAVTAEKTAVPAETVVARTVEKLRSASELTPLTPEVFMEQRIKRLENEVEKHLKYLDARIKIIEQRLGL